MKEQAGPELYAELTKKYLEPDVRNAWYLKGMSKEQLRSIQNFYNQRYGGSTAN